MLPPYQGGGDIDGQPQGVAPTKNYHWGMLSNDLNHLSHHNIVIPLNNIIGCDLTANYGSAIITNI